MSYCKYILVLSRTSYFIANKASNLRALLTEEPILCYTILTVSSRYLKLPGQNGQSRGHLLHDIFFKCVQDGLQCLLWGFPLDRRSGMTPIGAIEICFSHNG